MLLVIILKLCCCCFLMIFSQSRNFISCSFSCRSDSFVKFLYKSKLILPFWGTWFNKYYSFGFLWLTNVNSFENTTAFLESCILSFWSGILVSYYMTLCFSSFFYLIRCADCSFFHLGGEIFRLTWLNVWDSVGFLSILGDTTFRLLFLLFEKRVIFIDFRVIYIFDFVKFQKTLRSFRESAI